MGCNPANSSPRIDCPQTWLDVFLSWFYLLRQCVLYLLRQDGESSPGTDDVFELGIFDYCDQDDLDGDLAFDNKGAPR